LDQPHCGIVVPSPQVSGFLRWFAAASRCILGQSHQRLSAPCRLRLAGCQHQGQFSKGSPSHGISNFQADAGPQRLSRICEWLDHYISLVGGRLGYAYRTPHAATKWAIVDFTQSLAKELGPDGIRVNAILPELVEGPPNPQCHRGTCELDMTYDEVEHQ